MTILKRFCLQEAAVETEVPKNESKLSNASVSEKKLEESINVAADTQSEV